MPVVSEHIVFLHLKRPETLLRSAFSLRDLLSVLPQVLVGLCGLGELRIHVLVLSGECLYVLEHLLRLRGFGLRQGNLFL